MKKFITLALALVLALSLAAPALAFTSDEYTADSSLPFDASIRLIDVTDTSFGVSFSSPATDRGYAKNEIVCAIADLVVPKGKTFAGNRVTLVEFTGDNVSLNVADNHYGAFAQPLESSSVISALGAVGAAGSVSGLNRYDWADDHDEGFRVGATALTRLSDHASSKERTYSWAFFAKVTGDDAFMRFAIGRNVDVNFTSGAIHPITGNYNIMKFNPTVATELSLYRGINLVGADLINGQAVAASLTAPTTSDKIVYVIMKDNNTPLFAVVCNRTTGRTEELHVYLKHADKVDPLTATGTFYTTFRVYPAGSSVYFQGPTGGGIVPAYTGIGLYGNNGNDVEKSYYNTLMTIYNTHFAGYYGLDILNVGNVLTDSFWNDLGNADDYYVEVAIEPWYSYVEVPPEIVVDPPKTGDAMNILGFVMIALAGLAVVAVKKVRA